MEYLSQAFHFCRQQRVPQRGSLKIDIFASDDCPPLGSRPEIRIGA